jgi:hypothetical protein
MGGTQRQPDPSELEQDCARRWWMNLAFIVLAAGCVMSGAGVGQFLGIVAGLPLGVAIKLAEMRPKVASEEFKLFVRELSGYRIAEFVGWLGVAGAAIFKQPLAFAWLLAGAWLYDAVTYYRHRPERLRHLYAVTMAIDYFRGFHAPWAYPLPLLAWAIWKT